MNPDVDAGFDDTLLTPMAALAQIGRPSMPSATTSPSIICAENIALLQLLHDVPASPSIRVLHAGGEDDDKRALSLEEERQLTGLLATLSSIRDDPNLITAVAVRETYSPEKQLRTSLEVLVAVNKQGPAGAEAYLDAVCNGLRSVFDVLSGISSEYDRQIEHAVFIRMISVCRDRILSRLRFGKKAPGKKTKIPLQKPLRDMCDAVAESGRQDARVFIEGTRKLIAALARFEKHQTDEEIPLLVEEADSWTRISDISNFFRSVPSSALSGSSCEEYWRIFSKIGQYRTAARHLYRLARKIEALRSATVIPVRLGPDAFIRPDTTGYVPSLDDTLNRIPIQKTKKNLLARMSVALGKGDEALGYEFARNTLRILKESKIHAEIQILVYLNALPAGNTFITRVVQSNKKACFLCNELLALSEHPETPKSHGRLYTGWMMPSLPAMKPLQLRLNESLQRRASQSIEAMLQKNEKIDLLYPVESSALTVSDLEVSEDERSDLVPGPDGPNVVVSDVIASPAQPVAPEQDTQVDRVGSPDSGPSFRLSAGETSSVHTFGDSDMTVQYSTGPAHPASKGTLAYRVRKLEDREMVSLKSQNVTICDVVSLQRGTEVVLAGPSPFYVDLGGTVVELTLE